MEEKFTAGTRRDWVTADAWFVGGRRVRYDPKTARVVPDGEAAAGSGVLKVFERTTAGPGGDAVWLTLLPGFPDGSYGWAQVDRLLPAGLGPRLYVEPVGQGDSDKPKRYRHSTYGRADLVEALWRHHGVRRTVVVTFDYGSLALLELLRRRLESDRTAPAIAAVLMVNGGLFADAHTHPWQGTPMLRSPLGAAIARELKGEVPLYVGGSDEDPYEHRQVTLARERVPDAQIITFPGGHLTTSEHPDLLAGAVTEIASRHGVENRSMSEEKV
ncbi:hypothetical protein EV649_4384 [Kribbella sp. VKM Ac-2569]|uniref:alpha/beta fold hydrolase n=1 Tax=Kribbella sp. VKM Ac-2569 TaxID=2512220 RepID=UPI00102B5234|nr:alpha/beta hydrolase [Kribbella sp. VKM Ac-2569]RZT16851.1 hypothetical protein EV649_4384 [Kribbella sp. VKM Ac-2569]